MNIDKTMTDEADSPLHKVETTQFHSTPVFIGMKLLLETRRGSEPARIAAQLVGYLPGKCIILKVPKTDLSMITCAGMSFVVVRYLLDGSAYGFKTRIIPKLDAAFDLVFLQYPDVVETANLRKSPRIKTNIPFLRDGSESDKESIVNISETGAQLLLETSVQKDDTCLLEFRLPDGREVSELSCVVKWTESHDGRYLAGVQFDTEHPDFSIVGQYVSGVLQSGSEHKPMEANA